MTWVLLLCAFLARGDRCRGLLLRATPPDAEASGPPGPPQVQAVAEPLKQATGAGREGPFEGRLPGLEKKITKQTKNETGRTAMLKYLIVA